MSLVLQRVERYRVEREAKTDNCLHAVVPDERKLLRRGGLPYRIFFLFYFKSNKK